MNKKIKLLALVLFALGLNIVSMGLHSSKSVDPLDFDSLDLLMKETSNAMGTELEPVDLKKLKKEFLDEAALHDTQTEAVNDKSYEQAEANYHKILEKELSLEIQCLKKMISAKKLLLQSIREFNKCKSEKIK